MHICASSKLPGDADALGPHFENHGPLTHKNGASESPGKAYQIIPSPYVVPWLEEIASVV